MKLKDLIYTIDANFLNLLAGKQGLDRDIKWFTVIETVSHSAFINQGDLVFFTGFGLDNEHSLYDLTASLFEQKAAGVVFAPGPYINTIPDNVIKFCNTNNFPIFIMPWGIKISTLTHNIAEYLLFQKSSDEEKLDHILQDILLKNDDICWSDDVKAMIDSNNLFAFSRARVLLIEVNDKKAIPNQIHNSEKQLLIETILKNIETYIDKMIYLNTISVGFKTSQAYILVDKSWNKFSEDRMVEDLMSLILNLSSSFVNSKIVIGIGNFHQGVENINKSYKEACFTTHIFKQKKQQLTSEFYYSNIRSYKLIFENPNKESLRNFYLETLGALEEYDRIHHDSLLDFLKEYINCNCNINNTSAELFIHKNTVIYKLKKVESILNCNINQNEDILDIWIAFLIKDASADQIHE